MCKEQCDGNCDCDNKGVVLVGASGEPIANVIDPEIIAELTSTKQGMSPEDAAQIEQLIEELAAQPVDPCEKVYPTLRNERGEKLGRNDPCPCGSNKKWKQCCQKRF